MGLLTYRKKLYEYTIYFTPLTQDTTEEVIKFFGNRIRDGKLCLGVNEKYISDNIKGNKSIAYIKVNERGYDDYATASLKSINWCQLSTPQIFVMTLCRSGSHKSTVSPVGALFKLSEIIAKNMGEKFIYLFPQQGEGVEKLIEIYKGYGFRPNSCNIPGEYPMRKKISGHFSNRSKRYFGTRKRRRSS